MPYRFLHLNTIWKEDGAVFAKASSTGKLDRKTMMASKLPAVL
jgi:hypothetical protein